MPPSPRTVVVPSAGRPFSTVVSPLQRSALGRGSGHVLLVPQLRVHDHSQNFGTACRFDLLSFNRTWHLTVALGHSCEVDDCRLVRLKRYTTAFLLLERIIND